MDSVKDRNKFQMQFPFCPKAHCSNRSTNFRVCVCLPCACELAGVWRSGDNLQELGVGSLHLPSNSNYQACQQACWAILKYIIVINKHQIPDLIPQKPLQHAMKTASPGSLLLLLFLVTVSLLHKSWVYFCKERPRHLPPSYPWPFSGLPDPSHFLFHSPCLSQFFFLPHILPQAKQKHKGTQY